MREPIEELHTEYFPRDIQTSAFVLYTGPGYLDVRDGVIC